VGKLYLDLPFLLLARLGTVVKVLTYLQSDQICSPPLRHLVFQLPRFLSILYYLKSHER